METRTGDRRYRSITAAAAGALVLAAGCAGPHASEPPPPGPRVQTQTPDDIPGLSALLLAAEEQAKKPVLRTLTAPPPPGVEPILAERIRTVEEGGDPAALRPLAELIDEFAAASRAAAAPPGPAVERDERIADAALRHYVEGRQRLLQDDAEGALAELRLATELDPAAGPPWRELGEALLHSGARAEAIHAFLKAAAAGLEDPRALEFLGRDALDRADVDAAAGYLARASLAEPHRLDPVLPLMIDVALSRVLAAKGHVAAAQEALLRVARRPMQLASSTRYGNEFGAIFRRQGEIWRDIGDASCRLGRYSEALDAYRRSADLPSLDLTSVTPRIVLAAMRAGRPAAAAIEVLREIYGAGGRVGQTEIQLLRYVAQNGSLGSDLAAALGAYQRAMPEAGPSVASSLARTRAAVAPGTAGRAILRDHLAADPHDIPAAVELFSAIGDPDGIAAQAASLAAAAPLSAPSLAEAILRANVEAAAPALERAQPRPAAHLVFAYVKSRQGLAAAAADLAVQAPQSGRLAPAAALARVEFGVDAARPDMIRLGLSQLKALPEPDASRARAKALLLLQRCRAGIGAIEPLLAPAPAQAQSSVRPSEHLNDLLLGANLALSLSDGDLAEKWLQEAAALDPLDDRAPSGLLSLYGAGGAKADPARMNQVARDIRQSIPDGRTLRLVRAQELLRRSMFDQAESEAAALADEDPADATPIDMLVTSWLRRSGAERDEAVQRGRAWLETRLQSRPLSPPILAGLTALLCESGNPAEAETRLRNALRDGGGPDVSRLLERVLRTELGRAPDADAMALARLEGRSHTPGEAVELAELYSHLERDRDAAAALRAGLPASGEDAVVLSSKQSSQLLALSAAAAGRAAAGDDQAKLAGAMDLLDAAAERNVEFPHELHVRRILLLAASPDADADRILAAADLAAAQHPVLAETAYIGASEALAQEDRGQEALALLPKAAQRIGSPGTDFYFQWLRVIVATGSAAHARSMIDSASQAGRLRDLLRAATGGGESDSAKDARAEAAYLMGNFFAAGQKDRDADAAYELALEYDPNHAWACNNLGYSLADRGLELERAADLLERAHAALPAESAITDSLGWLRYKQGIIDDQADPNTGEIRTRGAVTLLKEAVDAAQPGDDNPVHLDHLGDALWRAGRRDEAVACWERTEAAAQRQLRDIARRRGRDPSAELPPAAVEEYRRLRESAGAKRRAARAGESVGVAPQLPALPPSGAETPAPTRGQSGAGARGAGAR